MKKSLYTCANCDFRKIPPELVYRENFSVCPMCGHFYPVRLNEIEEYFSLMRLCKELEPAKQLFLKTELVAAIRESVITLELIVKHKSQLDLSGRDLMAKAFGLEFDLKTKTIKRLPKIAINSLKSISERDEQEGIMYLAMGAMQAIRNNYLHTSGNRQIARCLQIFSTINFIICSI